ncbi:MAG TPA: hypothetical protein VHR66_27930, partial [Gemmataceae bacterium]|nr:hypothetical protein [Gemmataceae bacterium]
GGNPPHHRRSDGLGSGRPAVPPRTDQLARSATFLGRQALHFSFGVYTHTAPAGPVPKEGPVEAHEALPTGRV